MEIKEFANNLRHFEGLLNKKLIRVINDGNDNVKSRINLDEDGVLFPVGNNYMVAACDSIRQEICRKNPYNAGRAVIVACVNDIYAMGGRPKIILNSIGAMDSDDIRSIVKGMAEASDLFGLNIDGGHLLPPGSHHCVSATVIGEVKNPVLSTTLKKDHYLILVTDLNGESSPASQYIWNSTFNKSPSEVKQNYETISILSEKGCFTAGKDISNAGIIGTIAILLESSGVGAVLNIDKINIPDHIERDIWLRSFLSFGFVFGVKKKNLNHVTKQFKNCGLCVNKIGVADKSSLVFLESGGQKERLFDWEKDAILKR